MNSNDIFDRAEPNARREHKRHILRVALHCFDENGIDATTIEGIRSHAESSIGSMYHHFGNKEGLVAALYFIALDDQLALMQPRIESASDAKSAVTALVGGYMEWVVQEPKMARYMFQARSYVSTGSHKDALADRNNRRYKGLLKLLMLGVENGAVRQLPREVYASLLVGQSENYCRAWLSGRVEGSPTDYTSIFAEAAWRSIAS
jgi:AcrR family transcriptional regulator